MKFIKSLIKDTFNRDILVLVLVSILIGSALASTVSYAANAYFSKAVSGLVGDYGQYDLVIQVREEMKDDAMQQIQKVINDVFPGSTMKEGPTVTGKTNIFVALPDQFKTKQVYEDLSKTFGSIPGGAGVGVMSEPVITIRGVPDGAKNMLMDRIMQLDGVRFAFRDGASIGVLLNSIDKAATVNSQIEAILKQSQVIEVSFPVGSEPDNPIRLGDAIAADMRDQFKVDAQNASVDGRNDDMTYMVSTMMELKRFLNAYATQVTVTPTGGVKLQKGDVIVFQGTAPAAPVNGNAPDKANVLMMVNSIGADGSGIGVITQGDASQLTNLQGYKLDKNVVGAYVGNATYRNPRQQLGSALNDTSKLVGQIPGFAQDAQKMSGIALGVLDNYNTSIAAMDKTVQGIQAASSTIQAATSGLANIDTSSLQSQLDSSSKAMGGLINTLQVFKLVQSDAGSTIDSLTSTKQNLDNMKSTLGALDNVAANARQARSAIDGIVANGQSTMATLKAFDANGARSSLTDASGRLAQLQQINTPQIAAQLQYMAAAAPNLKDEDINHSVSLLDKFIAGQAIPGERIQIITTSNISTDAVTPIVYREAGHNNLTLYSSALGTIEPNARTQLAQVLTEVKSILAGMTAIIITVLFLVFDHTGVMTVIRRKRLVTKVKRTGWKGVMDGFTAIFTAPERQYGMAIGAVMLTAMFLISRGGIPYLPWAGVPFIGALLGLFAANYCEKISPLASDEVQAGEALGLSLDEIMREIVIPAARPGLLQKLNSRKVKFR